MRLLRTSSAKVNAPFIINRWMRHKTAAGSVSLALDCSDLPIQASLFYAKEQLLVKFHVQS
jgi:hypothetical protein